MARVSVEQKALTDSRFAHLGLLLLDLENMEYMPPMGALGLGVMVHVWNECQERETKVLPAKALNAIGYSLGIRAPLCRLIVDSDLAELVGEHQYRIKGAEGRIEWLGKARESNRERQKKHRERNAVTNALVTPVSRGALTPALAPTPESPSETQETTTLARSASPKRAARSPLNPPDDPELVERFEKLYTYYPRHVGKDAAWKAFKRLRPDLELCKAIALNIKARVDSGSWVPDDPERSRFIPHLSAFLNQKRWEDEDVA